MSNTRKISYLLSLSAIAFIASVGSLFLTSTPCNIAEGQTICDIGDDETIGTSLTLENELLVAPLVAFTPTAGNDGDVLVSRGAGFSPRWYNGAAFDYISKTADQTVVGNSYTDDDDIVWNNLENGNYVIEGLLLVSGNPSNDLKIVFQELDGTQLEETLCRGMLNDPVTPTTINDGSNLCALAGVTALNVDVTTRALHIYLLIEDLTSSDIKFRFSENTGSGGTTIHEGSILGLAKIG